MNKAIVALSVVVGISLSVFAEDMSTTEFSAKPATKHTAKANRE